MKLYEYDDIIATLYRAAENEEGIDPETGMVFDVAKLDALEMERNRKIENTLLYAAQLQADADEINDYARRLKERAKAKENTIYSLKQWISYNIQKSGEHRFETNRIRATLSIRKANKTVITDADAIPPKYLKTKIELDTSAIKAAIKAGEVVPGAMLEDSVSLTIK